MSNLMQCFYNITKLQLKEGTAIKDSDKFLKKYDKNNNSVFDSGEIEEFYNDLEKFVGDDLALDSDESIRWYSKITGKSIDTVRRDFAENNQVYNSIDNLLLIQARESSIKQISKEADEASEIYQKATGGYIAQGFNSIKELFKTEYAGDKVYRQIAAKKVAGYILDKANKNDGLKAKEYIQVKLELLEELLGKDSLSAAEQQKLKQGIMNLNGKELEEYIFKLVNAENSEYSSLQKQLAKDIQAKGQQAPDSIGFATYRPDSVGGMLKSANAEKKLTFEQIYYQETGAYFSQEAIDNYDMTNRKVNVIVNAYNKITPSSNKLKESISFMEGVNRNGGVEQEVNTAYKQLSNTILSTLKDFYGEDEASISDFLSKNGASLEGEGLNKKIVFGAKGVDTFAIVNLAKSLKSQLDSGLEKIMDGKTLEDYENELKEAYKTAYGDKNVIDLASKFQESQAEGVEDVKMIGMGAGLAVAVLSNGTIVPLLGTIGSIVAPSLIQGVEDVSKPEGMTKEDAKAIAKELAMSGILTMVGIQEGKAAAQIGKKLLGCGKLMSALGEYGSMAVMGALTNYAIMGDIDLSHECISNVINIAVGMVTHHKIAKAQSRQNAQKNITKMVEQNTINKPIDPEFNTTMISKISNKKFLKTIAKENPEINIKDLKNYVAKIDFAKIQSLAPKFKDYSNEDLAKFITYHYKNGTTEFNESTLKVANLTEYLRKTPLDNEKLDELLKIFPMTDRNIGTYPEGWLNSVQDVQTADAQIKAVFEDFQAKIYDLDYHMADYKTKSSYNIKKESFIQEFQQNLSIVLNNNVSVEFVGAGCYGSAFKIAIPNAKPVVVKIFNPLRNTRPNKEVNFIDHTIGNYTHPNNQHGQWAETQKGPFLNENSDMFAHFYFGKVSSASDTDGYMVVEYIKDTGKTGQKIDGNTELSNNEKYHIESEDVNGSHNASNGKIYDYGGVKIEEVKK